MSAAGEELSADAPADGPEEGEGDGPEGEGDGPRGEGALVEVAPASRAASPPLQKIAQEIREGPSSPTLVAGLIAWSITVAPVGFGRAATGLSELLALAALVASVAGPLLLRARPRLGRHVGISLFIGFSAAVWVAGSTTIHPLRLEPVRGALGAIAWGVFAVSWSERWGSQAELAAPDRDAPALLARSTLAPLAAPIVAAGVAAGVGYLALSFQVRDPDRALLAQAAAVLCAVAVVSASATVATARGKHRSAGGRRFTPPVVRALLLLVTFALAGALVSVLR